jgi:hypothetical protein
LLLLQIDWVEDQLLAGPAVADSWQGVAIRHLHSVFQAKYVKSCGRMQPKQHHQELYTPP